MGAVADALPFARLAWRRDDGCDSSFYSLYILADLSGCLSERGKLRIGAFTLRAGAVLDGRDERIHRVVRAIRRSSRVVRAFSGSLISMTRYRSARSSLDSIVSFMPFGEQ
jgi:hypothetical protein